MDKCDIAIIGAGYTAKEHLRAFTDLPNVKIKGIFSRTRLRAETLADEFGITAVYDSVAELYNRTQAKLVVVTVNELSVNSVCQACFEYPWAVLTEKPAGYDLADCEDIYQTSLRKKRKVYVAHNRRFYSSTRAVFQDIKEIQGPRFIKVQDQEDQTAALDAGQPKKVVDNWMYANSIHLIDYLRIFGRGNITTIEPIIPWDPDDPGVVLAKIHFNSNDIGIYEGIWKGPAPWAVTIQTPSKRWEMRPLEQAAYQLVGQRKMEPIQQHPWDQQFKPGFRLQAEHAIAAALGKVNDLVTLEDSLKTMRLIKDIFSLE